MRRFEWRAKCRTAVLETKISAIDQELADAERAISTRRGELAKETGADVEVEREALDDAEYALAGLRTALTHRSDAA
jgi:hypothetical protein